MEIDMNLFYEDIKNIYEELVKNNIVRKLGIVNHDIFQDELFKLGKKYGLNAKKEYCGKYFIDSDTDKKKRGRIDLVYYKDTLPYITLEIDSGFKKSSVKKLLANDDFKYRIWFCYKNDMNRTEYNSIIDVYDKNKELIYLLPKAK